MRTTIDGLLPTRHQRQRLHQTQGEKVRSSATQILQASTMSGMELHTESSSTTTLSALDKLQCSEASQCSQELQQLYSYRFENK